MKNKKIWIAIAGLALLIIASYGLYYVMGRKYDDTSQNQSAIGDQNNQGSDSNTSEEGELEDEHNGLQGVDIGENSDFDDGIGQNQISAGDSEPIVTARSNTSDQNANMSDNNAAAQSNDSAAQSDSQGSAQSNSSQSGASSGQTATQSSSQSATQADTSGTAATDFTVYTANGTAVNLSQFYGKPIVVNFWASWCSPCKNEMPYFQSAYETYGSSVQFVMVNLTDGSKETKNSASNYISNQGYTFPVYYDTSQSAADAYAVYSIPQTFFINKNGRLVSKTMGSITKTNLISNITSLIGS